MTKTKPKNQSFSLIFSKILLLFSIFLFVCTVTLFILNRSEWSRPFTTSKNTNSPLPTTDYKLLTSTATISSVHDGDTIYTSGIKEGIRLIGIDAPELAYSYKCMPKCTKNECGAAEAKEKLKELILNKQVVLASDSSTANKDIYNRLLRYIYLCPSPSLSPSSSSTDYRLLTTDSPCTDISLQMIKLGLAKESGFGNEYSKQKEYKKAELGAKSAKRGIWGAYSN